MRIQLLNPNTSDAMTQTMLESAQSVALTSTEIIAATPNHGPKSIECAVDEAIASGALLDQIEQGVNQGVDAHIIACFGDPGLDAARELASAPVIGIAQAGFQFASIVAHKFSVVTTLSRTLGATEMLLQKYGYQHQCVSARATDIPVLALENIEDDAYQQLRAECELAIKQDQAEAIVLGCAGMSNLVAKLSADLASIPIIDGVSAAVKIAESLNQLSMSTSKIGNYGAPVAKAYIGRYSHFSR